MYTIEQFKKQNAFWGDKYYYYAIHITDGGAMYLFQVNKPLTQKNIDNASVIRLDGCDMDKLYVQMKGVAK